MLENELTGATRWVVPLLIFGGVLTVGLILRTVAFRALGRWSKTTTTEVDDLLLQATRWPSYLWIVITAAILAFQTIDLPGEKFDVAARRTLGVLLALSITVGVARFLGGMADARRDDAEPDRVIASTGLLRTMVQGATYLIGLLVILGILGINIAPLLGALGVGGLAAGLALQSTLSNLFAGFQIAVAKQIRVGHRVRLASGEEGYVADISWRTTTLRTPLNHLIIVPNSKFADSIITNFNLPDPAVNLLVPINVSYESDARRVEAVLRDEATKLVAELPGVVRESAPVVRFLNYGESALQFTVALRVLDFESQLEIWNEIYQRILERLRREKIEMAFPTRMVFWRGSVPPAGGPPAGSPTAGSPTAGTPPEPKRPG